MQETEGNINGHGRNVSQDILQNILQDILQDILKDILQDILQETEGNIYGHGRNVAQETYSHRRKHSDDMEEKCISIHIKSNFESNFLFI